MPCFSTAKLKSGGLDSGSYFALYCSASWTTGRKSLLGPVWTGVRTQHFLGVEQGRDRQRETERERARERKRERKRGKFYRRMKEREREGGGEEGGEGRDLGGCGAHHRRDFGC
jgi:hypothetical protein